MLKLAVKLSDEARRAKFGDMPAEEERRLFELWRDHGDVKARDKLLESQQRFIKSYANKYSRASSTFFDDLVQEGNIALMRALKTYNPDEASFGAYAQRGVKNDIQRAFFESTSILSFDVDFREVRRKMKSALKALGYKQAQVLNEKDYRKIAHHLDVKVEVVRAVVLMKFSPEPSLNTPLNHENGAGGLTWMDTIADDSTDVEGEQIERNVSALRREWLIKAFDTLEPRERIVIEARLGNPGMKPKGLAEKLGMSRDRINTSEDKAKRKIRNFFRRNIVQIRQETGDMSLNLDMLFG